MSRECVPQGLLFSGGVGILAASIMGLVRGSRYDDFSQLHLLVLCTPDPAAAQREGA